METGSSPSSLIVTGATSATRTLDKLLSSSSGIITNGAPVTLFAKRIHRDYSTTNQCPSVSLDDLSFNNIMTPAALGTSSVFFVRNANVTIL